MGTVGRGWAGVWREYPRDVPRIAPWCRLEPGAEPWLGLHWRPKVLQSPQTQPCPCAGSAGMSGSRQRSRLAHGWCRNPSLGLSHSHGHGVATRVTRTYQGPLDDGDTGLIPVGLPPGTGKGAAPERWRNPASPRQWPCALPRSPVHSVYSHTLPCIPVLSRGCAPPSHPTDEAQAGRPALGETSLQAPGRWLQDQDPRGGADQAPR